jgi:alginate O-acetyltransferase complex protein AlgI
MLFSSFEFIFIFLPVTFFIYFYLNSKKLVVASKWFLIFSSLIFYSWWNIVYLPIILTSILFNYFLGNSLAQSKSKKVSNKHILIIGITSNLLLLGYFKYTDFFISNTNSLFNSNIELINLALPLAISFFTFQQIAYLVDSYRGEIKAYDFVSYALFVSFFPQLIAGPIVHHKEMMPQFTKLKNKYVNYKNISLGIFIFSIGLFKKIVIADSFAIFANNGFNETVAITLLEAWATSLSYTFQLYFDFSGYVDMAMGAALLFNIRLPINFNSPYKSFDIQDFWRRWHMTLSRFLKDYIYIPLGGNRVSNFRIYSNLMATFIIGGFWHGAGWTFLFWGFLHGFAISIHRAWSSFGFKLWNWFAWLLTFNFVNFAWVFFRADEWADAINIIKGMIGLNGFSPLTYAQVKNFDSETINNINIFLNVSPGDLAIYLVIATSTLLILHKNNSIEMMNSFIPSHKNLVFIILIYLVSFMFMNSMQLTEFLYFDF